jgi:hypothetical protein
MPAFVNLRQTLANTLKNHRENAEFPHIAERMRKRALAANAVAFWDVIIPSLSACGRAIHERIKGRRWACTSPAAKFSRRSMGCYPSRARWSDDGRGETPLTCWTIRYSCSISGPDIVNRRQVWFHKTPSPARFVGRDLLVIKLSRRRAFLVIGRHQRCCGGTLFSRRHRLLRRGQAAGLVRCSAISGFNLWRAAAPGS